MTTMMNPAIKRLIDEVEKLKAGRSPLETLFLSLVQQVWEVDPSVSPSMVLSSMRKSDIHFFQMFMDRDQGDEAVEGILLQQLFDRTIRMQIQSPNFISPMLGLVSQVSMIGVRFRPEN